jgi:glycosyltransferase involved in cell wall biosynthesis
MTEVYSLFLLRKTKLTNLRYLCSIMQKNISVISTYNSTEWLKKSDLGTTQTYRTFEMVIADDGSRQDTFDLIEELKKKFFIPSFMFGMKTMVFRNPKF